MRKITLVAAVATLLVLLARGISVQQVSATPSAIADTILASIHGGQINCVTCEPLSPQCTSETTDACEYTQYPLGDRLCLDEGAKCWWQSCTQDGQWCQDVGKHTSFTCERDDDEPCDGERNVYHCVELWLDDLVWCGCSPLDTSVEDCSGDKTACHMEPPP